MTFYKLSRYLEKMEETSSRLSLIDLLSDLFKETKSSSELMEICYLIQGRIAPFFAPIEMGMAEKTVAASIASAYGMEKSQVLKLFNKLGDMGKAAYELADKNEKNPKLSLFDSQKKKKTELTVEDVSSVFLEIAGFSGEGTVEKRQNLLTNLLQETDSLSVKYLVRIPLGNLRLGIGDPTILDGLAKSMLGDKNKRKLLEGAYNRTSDLGLIAKTLKDKGLKAVENLQVQIGKPIRAELCERLPTPEKVIEKMEKVDVQYKYDGFRVQIHKDGDNIYMFSRNLENMTHMLPELIEAAKKQIKAKSAILDTEALAFNTESEEFLPFQETTKRRRKHNVTEMARKLPLKAFVFDILYKDGKSLIDVPLEERMKILKETVVGDDVLIPSENKIVDNGKELSILLDDAISKGLEGLVVKRLDSKYEAGGRNFNWVKLKRNSSGELNDTIDCVVLGYITGKGKRTAFGAGALLAGIYDNKKDEFVTICKIGTGLTDDEWREIHKRADKIKVAKKPARVSSQIAPSVWIAPEIVIEILADEITRSPIHTAGKKDNEPGYALRFPRLVSFRSHDKKAEDATTVEELV
ncbi:ATP-dependent DNA ligase, partial [Patescibacteria group bacterium]|nr:ATP-dependent DNA ligase [Patescibacteria group bacterium]